MIKIIYDGTAETTSHKEVFANTIESLMNEDDRVIFLDADLMNSSGTYKLWKEKPERVINCGVAEANMMGIAAGLSAVGRTPYVHTFGPFASRRCFDQVFLSIGYAGNSVRIYGSDAGVTAEFNGGTHMPFEDMTLMRAIPGARVFDLADGVQFESVIRAVKDLPGVTYMRSTRKQYRKIYEKGSTFEIGKGCLLNEGTDISIIACGLMVSEAMLAADLLKDEGISAEVIDMFTVKPIDKDLIVKTAKRTGAVVTSENHNVIGGLGDAIAACLLEENVAVPFRKHGVQDLFGQVGPIDYLKEVYGLTAKALAETCKKVLKEKKQ
ncbi:MAG: transketolase family protein [Saccharofermentanales bacterium]